MNLNLLVTSLLRQRSEFENLRTRPPIALRLWHVPTLTRTGLLPYAHALSSDQPSMTKCPIVDWPESTLELSRNFPPGNRSRPPRHRRPVFTFVHLHDASPPLWEDAPNNSDCMQPDEWSAYQTSLCLVPKYRVARDPSAYVPATGPSDDSSIAPDDADRRPERVADGRPVDAYPDEFCGAGSDVLVDYPPFHSDGRVAIYFPAYSEHLAVECGAIRLVQIDDEAGAGGEFLSIAEETSSLLVDLPATIWEAIPCGHDRSMEAGLRWLSCVFELAWAKLPGSLLRPTVDRSFTTAYASIQGGAGLHESLIDLEKCRRPDEFLSMAVKLPDLTPANPVRWFSALADAAESSSQAIDVLLSHLGHVPSRAPRRSGQGGRPPKWDDLVVFASTKRAEDPKVSNEDIVKQYNTQYAESIRLKKMTKATVKALTNALYDHTRRKRSQENR